MRLVLTNRCVSRARIVSFSLLREVRTRFISFYSNCSHDFVKCLHIHDLVSQSWRRLDIDYVFESIYGPPDVRYTAVTGIQGVCVHGCDSNGVCGVESVRYEAGGSTGQFHNTQTMP